MMWDGTSAFDNLFVSYVVMSLELKKFLKQSGQPVLKLSWPLNFIAAIVAEVIPSFQLLKSTELLQSY